jgi:hypothetical protein
MQAHPFDKNFLTKPWYNQRITFNSVTIRTLTAFLTAQRYVSHLSYHYRFCECTATYIPQKNRVTLHVGFLQ